MVEEGRRRGKWTERYNIIRRCLPVKYGGIKAGDMNDVSLEWGESGGVVAGGGGKGGGVRL